MNQSIMPQNKISWIGYMDLLYPFYSIQLPLQDLTICILMQISGSLKLKVLLILHLFPHI